jgi:hypothetical protein
MSELDPAAVRFEFDVAASRYAWARTVLERALADPAAGADGRIRAAHGLEEIEAREAQLSKERVAVLYVAERGRQSLIDLLAGAAADGTLAALVEMRRRGDG